VKRTCGALVLPGAHMWRLAPLSFRARTKHFASNRFIGTHCARIGALPARRRTRRRSPGRVRRVWAGCASRCAASCCVRQARHRTLNVALALRLQCHVDSGDFEQPIDGGSYP
jgi:hypothetical protein